MAWYAGSARRDLLAMAAYIGGVAGVLTALVIGASSIVPPRSGQAVAETTGSASKSEPGTEERMARPAKPPPIVEHRPVAIPAVTPPSVGPKSTAPMTNYAAAAKKKAQAELGQHRKPKREPKRETKPPSASPAAREAYGYAPPPARSYSAGSMQQHGVQ